MSRTVRVTGLPNGTTEAAVEAFFSRVGGVSKVAVQPDAALVSFVHASDAVEALMLAGVEFADAAPLGITEHEEAASERREADADRAVESHANHDRQVASSVLGDAAVGAAGLSATANAAKGRQGRDALSVVVRSLTPDTAVEHLRDFFADCGPITDVYISPDPHRHYAFVRFADASGRAAALAKNGEVLNGAKVTIEGKRLVSHGNRLYVTGLPPDITEEALRTFFSVSADCTVVDMFLDATKGMAFVNVDSAEELERAVAKSGSRVGGSEVTVVVRPRACPVCGRPGHPPVRCPNRFGVAREDGVARAGDRGGGGGRHSIVCHACGQTGHIARECRSGTRRDEDRHVDRRSDDSHHRDHQHPHPHRSRRRSCSRSDSRERRHRAPRDGSRDRRRRHRSRSRSWNRSRSHSREGRDGHRSRRRREDSREATHRDRHHHNRHSSSHRRSRSPRARR